MAWAFVGVSTVVEVTATSHTLTLPASTQPGDLLVAVISSRIASTTSITLPSGWTLVAESKTNNVVAAATTSEASGMMAYMVRGDATPNLTFTHPVAPSVAVGRIVAYRGGNRWSPFDVGIGAKTSPNVTAVSTTGLTTSEANELIVKGFCSGRAATSTTHDAATDPTTSSGTSSVQTAAPIVGTWQERQDASTATGADTGLAIADAIRGTAGATGALTCTASLAGGHCQVAGAFKIETNATAGSSSITQTGSTLSYTNASIGEGTVSSTITVPSDAQIVLVALQGWSDAAPVDLVRMYFTRGGADTPMFLIAPPEVANAQRVHMWYLVLPDTGSNKTLKWKWYATDPAETPLITVTFWKGIDTASPVRSWGFSEPALNSSAFRTRSSLLTAQNGDLVVAFAGGDCGGNAEHTVTTWYNLNEVSECTNGGVIRHDGAWGSFAPSGNLYVGADTSSGMSFGGCVAVVLKPSGGSLTTRTDDFNRANSADLGANWTTVSSANPLEIFSNTVRGTDGSERAEAWTADVFGSQQYSQAKLTTASGWFYLLLRIQDMYYPNYYYARINRDNNEVIITRQYDWTADDPPLASTTYTIAATDLVRFEAEGSTLRVKVNGTTILTATDSTNSFPDGRPGIMAIWFAGTAPQLDDWEGGEWSAPTSVTGTLGVTDAKDVLAATGSVYWDATLQPTEGKDTLLFNGSVYWPATLGVTDTKDTLAFTGSVYWAAPLAATEGRDTLSITGSVYWEGQLVASEGRDTASFVGGVLTPVDGTLGVTEPPDIASFAGTVQWLATFAASEASDIAAFVGDVVDALTGTMAAPEGADVASFEGSVTWLGQLAATEASDFASLAGNVRWDIVMVASEERDIAEFEGVVVNPITGTLGVTESADSAFFEGAAAYSGYSQVVVIA